MKETQTYPTVSVIIRGYNRERYIGPAIESVLAQTYTDFDLLIWDDGSTDKTARIAIEYAKKDRRIRVAACEHRGAVKSLKAAVADTFGAYLCWVDSDDLLSPTAFWTSILRWEWSIPITSSLTPQDVARGAGDGAAYSTAKTGCFSIS